MDGPSGRHFLARLRPYRTVEDRIDGVVIAFIDITERKRAEAALAQSEEQFRLLVDGARDYAMFLMDQDRRIVFWSRGAQRVFGWTEQEALGQLSDIIFTPEDRAAGVPEAEANTAWHHDSALDQRWHVRKDGSRLWADGLLTRLEKPTPERSFVKVARDATVQHRAEEALQEAHDELENRVRLRTHELEAMNESQTALYQRLVTAQEEERRRISRELHDETGQDLTGLLLGLGTLKSLTNPDEIRDLVARLQTAGEILAKKLHEIAVTIRPTALDDMGLEEAMRTHVEDWSQSTGIETEFEAIGTHNSRLPTEIETTVYRVIQESLNNVVKHAAGVTRVSVVLQQNPTELLAIVEDNGTGFNGDPSAADSPSDPNSVKRRSLGLLGMQERAHQVGGTIEVESAPASGTTVYLRIPHPRLEGTGPSA